MRAAATATAEPKRMLLKAIPFMYVVVIRTGRACARVSVRATPRRRIEEMQMTGRQRNLQRVPRRGPMRVWQTHRHIVLAPATVREIVRAEQFARVNRHGGMCGVRLIRAHMLRANAERPVPSLGDFAANRRHARERQLRTVARDIE